MSKFVKETPYQTLQHCLKSAQNLSKTDVFDWFLLILTLIVVFFLIIVSFLCEFIENHSFPTLLLLIILLLL